MQGFGPVPVDDDLTFHGRWEERTHGVALFLMNSADLPAGLFRHFIEQLDPITYLTAGYYGRWLGAAERIAVDSGLLAGSELCRKVAELAGEPTDTIVDEPAERVIVGGSTGRGDRREATAAPKFAVGDRVRTQAHGIPSHTRLPAYARGRVGTIELVQDSWLFPDTCAVGDGDQPTWVYAVRFEAGDLWPEGEGVRDAVYIDLFEPYIQLEDQPA